MLAPGFFIDDLRAAGDVLRLPVAVAGPVAMAVEVTGLARAASALLSIEE